MYRKPTARARAGLASLIVGAAILAPGGSLPAAVLTVDTLADEVSAPGCSLRAAMINAENDDQSGSADCAAGSGADTIQFADSLAGQAITLGGSALPTITRDLVIEGPEARNPDSIVIDADGQSPILNLEVVDGAPVELVLRNLTLTGAVGDPEQGFGAGLRATDPSVGPVNAGSAGFAETARALTSQAEASGLGRRGEPLNIELELIDVVVHDNVGPKAPFDGGGIGVLGGSLLLERSVVSESATFGSGAGVAVLGQLTLIDSLVSNNTAGGESSRGGGISVFPLGDIALSGTVVRGNVTEGDASPGGGVFVLAIEPVEVEVADSLIQDNETGGNDSPGAGVMVDSGGSPATLSLIDGTQVQGNVTTGLRSPGGGVATVGLLSDERTPVNLVMERSVLADNATEGDESPGSGISVEYGDAFIRQSTVSANSTLGDVSDGGGVRVFNESSAPGEVLLVNSTVSGNTVEGDFSVAGGVLAGFATDATLRHATLVDNVDVTGSDGLAGTDGVHLTSGAGTELVLDNSLIVQDQGDVACSADVIDDSNSLATDASCTGAATPAAQIEIESLGDNGGPTPTHAIARTSVAIDAAGDCGADHGVSIDQRGEPRPGQTSAACDIGAFEHQASGVLFRDRFQ